MRLTLAKRCLEMLNEDLRKAAAENDTQTIDIIAERIIALYQGMDLQKAIAAREITNVIPFKKAS